MRLISPLCSLRRTSSFRALSKEGTAISVKLAALKEAGKTEDDKNYKKLAAQHIKVTALQLLNFSTSRARN